MNFSDHTQFMPSQTPYAGGSDAVNCWPPFPMSMNNEDQHSQFEQQPSPFKRPRNSEENQSNPMPYPPMNARMQPPNAPVNKGASNIFYKTRLCVNFKTGMCRNGENCNYAHGIEDIRHPPPNWQELVSVREEDRPPLSGNWDDDQKIIHRMKLCKKFYNGEECPYGDRCNFLHEDPAKFRDDISRFRENTAISIGTTGPSVVHGSGSNHSEENRLVNTGTDTFRVNMKPVYWKTKLCNKWETTGKCPFGEKCHFAHGQAELQVPGGRVEAEVLSSTPISTKPQAGPVNDSSTTAMAILPASNEEGGQGKKRVLKWKGSKKINRIYADWLDDVPLVHHQNLSSTVES
ncbi:hypothetical protein GBA52_022530 [Prunus armeniaca]|nr:hypothetical protein GBA52_022530 [Prunus armeniaca]